MQITAVQLGLHVVELPSSTLAPSALRLRPTLSVGEYATQLRGLKSSGGHPAVLPLFIDSDFLVPTLLLKVRYCPLLDCAFLTRLLMPQYYCFLFAGTTWNSAAVGDMLQVLFFTIATF